MDVGYRIFIVSGDEIVARLAQKTFDEFYLGKKPVLKKYAGMTLDLAMAFYETHNRRPYWVFRIESMRTKVSSSGAIDGKHDREASRLMIGMLDGLWDQSARKPTRGNVVDARSAFDARRRKARHTPGISARLRKNILAALGV